MPPFLQGFEMQGLMVKLQSNPVKPVMQIQLNDVPLETQRPLFLHESGVHRFICVLQFGPVKPGLQMQV